MTEVMELKGEENCSFVPMRDIRGKSKTND
jgi:hypothetical protein